MRSPSVGAGPAGGGAEFGGRLRDRRHRPGGDVLAVHQLEPLRQRTRGDRGREPGGDRLLVLVELAPGELGHADDLAEPLPELRLERTTVSQRPSAVA